MLNVSQSYVYAQQQGLLEQNVAALDIALTAGELATLDPLASQVTGARY